MNRITRRRRRRKGKRQRQLHVGAWTGGWWTVGRVCSATLFPGCIRCI